MFIYLKIEADDLTAALDAVKKQEVKVEVVDSIYTEFAKHEVDDYFENSEEDIRYFYEESGTSLSYEDYVTAAKSMMTSLLAKDSSIDNVYEACRQLMYVSMDGTKEIEAQDKLIKGVM